MTDYKSAYKNKQLLYIKMKTLIYIMEKKTPLTIANKIK